MHTDLVIRIQSVFFWCSAVTVLIHPLGSSVHAVVNSVTKPRCYLFNFLEIVHINLTKLKVLGRKSFAIFSPLNSSFLKHTSQLKILISCMNFIVIKDEINY